MKNTSPHIKTPSILDLSPRELEVVYLASLGYSDKKIATALSISKFTVASHWQNILLKNGAVNRTLVIARYSSAVARNEIREDQLSPSLVAATTNQPQVSRISQQLRRSLDKSVKDCRTVATERQNGKDEVLRRYLQECVMLTDSSAGFLLGLRQDTEYNYYISLSATFKLEPNGESPMVITGWNEVNPQPTDFGSWFLSVLQTTKAHISNEQSAESCILSQYLQIEGVECFMAFPLMHDGLPVGLLCLANRHGGYSSDIIEFLNPLLADCAAFLENWVSEVDRLAIDRQIANVALMLKTVTDEFANAFVYASPDGTILYLNHAFIKMFGLAESEGNFIGQPIASLVEECVPTVTHSEQFASMFQSLVASGESCFGQVVYMRDSRILELDSIGVREDGKCTGLLWKFSDITKLESECLAFSQVVNFSRDAIIVITNDGIVQYWNKQAEALFLYSAEEAIGKPLVELIIPDRYRDAHLEGLNRYRQTGVSRVMGQLIQVVGLRKCGTEVNIDLMLSCIDTGANSRYCAYIREALD